jgi:[ribosomal protein S5]-alanine N-acetyltransferase
MALLLSTERTRLRDFTPGDWTAVQAYGSRPEVYRFQPWGPLTPPEARGYVEQTIAQAQEQPRTNYTLAIALAATDEVIGSCGLIIRSQQFRQGEIAYFLHPDHWGRGYATEAAERLLDFGFTALGLHRLTATCDPRNAPSRRILEKIGMRYEGTLREAVLIREGWRDSLLYSLLEHEWRQHR